MHLKARRLEAGDLADHHRLNQIANDRHQTLLGVFIAIVAGEEEQLADGNLDIGRVELLLQLGDLLLIILGRRVHAGMFRHQLLTRGFQFIEMFVQNGKARPAFSVPVLDLLHQALLGCF